MEKHLTYQNVSWTVKMYWEYPETLSCPTISSIYLEGSTVDLYDFLDKDTIIGLQAELVESLKN